MKKTLFFVAAAALALTACTNETDIVQTPKQVEQQGVAFDVYLGKTVDQKTRGGLVNAITTPIMQKSGFGVFACVSNDDHNYATGVDIPDFMWNQEVFWNNTANAWYYAPLKYWPNETNNDSQASEAMMPDVSTHNHMDKVSFFAYAPWVRATKGDGDAEVMNAGLNAPDDVAITKMTAADGTFLGGSSVMSPRIQYVVATDPNNSVDLLWGVAPVGGLSYTAVDKTTVTVDEGFPLLNLKKPAVNTNLKFMFQHALSRLGVKVVLASDQVAAGGKFDFGNSKVTIEKIEITGKFGTEGTLLLMNTAENTPNWQSVTTAESTPFTIEEGKGLAPHLVYNSTLHGANSQQVVTGVTTDLADAIKVSSSLTDANYTFATSAKRNYSPTTPLFNDVDDNVTDAYKAFSFTKGSDIYLQKFTTNNLATDNKAFTDITATINTVYPYATVWTDSNPIYTISSANIVAIDGTNKEANASKPAYRKVGNIYTPTGVAPEVGDYVIEDANLTPVPKPTDASNEYFTAIPNYFMVIPPAPGVTDRNKINVKITYYVSTEDANLKDGILYTKNEVEKTVELPNFENGMAYNLKLILGLTSVKIEAEMSEWQTITSEVNLPQNISE